VGGYDNANLAGVFAFHNTSGARGINYGFRAVLSPL
jgi:hypothetical protein